jgi:FlaA1/EpsC-like NDP-sugar epimerase
LAFDLSTVLFFYFFATIIRLNFEYEHVNFYAAQRQILPVLLLYLTAFLATRSYSGIIRLAGIKDMVRLFVAILLAFALCYSLSVVLNLTGLGKTLNLALPRSVLMIHAMLVFVSLFSVRVFIRAFNMSIVRRERKKRVSVIIYGAGSAGVITRDMLEKDGYLHYEVAAFIDDNPSKINKRLDGIPVLTAEKALNTNFVQANGVTQLIIAIQQLPLLRKQEVTERALELHLEVKIVPPINNWIKGQLSTKQLRTVSIEDLLERPPIQLETHNIATELDGKVVLITGAAGSIGSEISRQVLQYNPAKVILIDQAETPLHDLQHEIRSSQSYQRTAGRVHYFLASVENVLRMKTIIKAHQPDIIYHAAAYKHVPLMEENPSEALSVNVFGTKVLADLAIQYQVNKFIMVSTDKAVNPTNVMGASKRIAEIYTQSLSNGQTHFITTRFGNVMGSNGSVIPLFRKQIESGGPITVTHFDITRYFMTIPEACNLVLEAGAMGQGGEIFVFDMGQAVKIYDLAHKMILLSGLEPDKDIQIVETGLRPGEKLYEELLTKQEDVLPTHHPKIMRARISPYQRDKAAQMMCQLDLALTRGDVLNMVATMKAFVPEFISNNSIFQTLDQKPKLRTLTPKRSNGKSSGQQPVIPLQGNG